MSNRKYGWWGYVKDIIRRYPDLCAELKEIKTQNIVPHYSALPSGGGDNMRNAEATALRTLSPVKMRELEAMESALRLTRNMRDGAERERMIDLVFWRQTHTLSGAAMKVNVSKRTAERWHTEFIKCVAGFYGFELEKNAQVGVKSS